MIQAVPNRVDEDRLDWQENQDESSGVLAAGVLGFLAGLMVGVLIGVWG